jgi:hypothetical protein
MVRTLRFASWANGLATMLQRGQNRKLPRFDHFVRTPGHQPWATAGRRAFRVFRPLLHKQVFVDT